MHTTNSTPGTPCSVNGPIYSLWALPRLPALVLIAGIFGGYFLLGYSPKEVVWPQGDVCYEVVVVSEVAEKDRTMGMDAVIVGSGHKLKCYVSKDGRSRQLQVGNRLQLTSRIEPNSNWQHGNFNYRRYLEVHGFSGQTFVKANRWKRKADSWKGLSLWQRVKLHFLCYRHSLLERYRLLGVSDAEYAVLAAMALGDKTAMTKDLKEVYAVSGASHVLALSGLHLGIIYVLLSMLVPGRRFRMVSQLLIVLSIWGFVLLVGMPVSVVRAAVMISICALLSIFHRNAVSLNSLSLAVICILLANPASIFDVGFQLSFAVPMDINYTDAAGLINLHAVSNDHTLLAHGANDHFIVGGSATAGNDSIGPSIYCYLNSPSFVNGGNVNTTPYFVAQLTDQDGINTTGNGVGHDLELIIDGDMSKTYVLNENFQFDFGSYTTGSTYYNIPELEPGMHTLLFRAWDVLNNSSTAQLSFNVVKGLSPRLFSVSCTQNPARTSTTFIVSHDRTGCTVDVELDIFDTSGRQLWRHNESGVSTDGAYTLTWDLTVDGGQRLQTGVYLYRVSISSDGSKQVSKAKKLVVIAP